MTIDRWTEALTWFVKLRASDQEELRNGVTGQWQKWHAKAENKQVFGDMTRLLTDRHLYRKRRLPDKAALETDSYDLSVPIAVWLNAQVGPHETRSRWPSAATFGWWLSSAIGIAAIGALFALSSLEFHSRGQPIRAIVYKTAVGGLKDVRLRDGSSIILGGRTEVSVAFSVKSRSVTLVSGQAWFKVVHHDRWPFVVSAGDDTITDLGTAFLVTRDSDRVFVTVTEGTVEVSSRPPIWSPLRLERIFSIKPSIARIRLSRGEEVAFAESGALSHVDLADPRAATAWIHGCLTFDDQSLRYVMETVERYSLRHIAIDPQAGALRFSGIVHENEIGAWLQSLETIYPVTVQESGNTVQIRMSLPAHPPR